MKSLSPKKYIETKARSLPMYKCLVNKDWQQAGIASVMVMRQHVNGNITGADFLVDLKCLGIKDSHYFFNEYEPDLIEKYSAANILQPINYTLAHNIVYAGYEFARAFGIEPDKSFATTQYILEEDTDAIPLMDIETGDNGIPHLIEQYAGQYADALLKLKKHAGEGNYHFTMAVSNPLSEEDEEVDDEEGYEDTPLSEIPVGELDLLNVQDVSIADLLNEGQLSSRNRLEQVICETEFLTRMYGLVNPDDPETDFMQEEWDLLPEDEVYATGIDVPGYNQAIDAFSNLKEETIADIEPDTPEYLAIQEKHLAEHQDNAAFISLVFEQTLFLSLPHTRALLNEYLQPFESLPLVQLLLAFESLLQNENTSKWSHLIKSRHFREALPGVIKPGNTELLYYWALQIIRNARAGSLSIAVAYYEPYSNLDNALAHIDVFILIVKELLPPLRSALDREIKKATAES